MAQIPTWPQFVTYWTEVMQANAALWQQFMLDAQAGTATVSEFFQDVALTSQNWMSLYALVIGAGGSPQPPSAFILGSPWVHTAPTKSATVRLELPLDPSTNGLLYPTYLSLLGGGANPYPLSLLANYVDTAGSQVKVDVSRSSTSGEDPTSGTHFATIYTPGEIYVANVMVLVP